MFRTVADVVLKDDLRAYLKMPAIRAQSALVLNRDLHDYAEWDEDAITTRGASLFKIAAQLWQAPPAPVPGPV